jgi:hypothetical protein
MCLLTFISSSLNNCTFPLSHCCGVSATCTDPGSAYRGQSRLSLSSTTVEHLSIYNTIAYASARCHYYRIQSLCCTRRPCGLMWWYSRYTYTGQTVHQRRCRRGDQAVTGCMLRLQLQELLLVPRQQIITHHRDQDAHADPRTISDQSEQCLQACGAV